MRHWWHERSMQLWIFVIVLLSLVASGQHVTSICGGRAPHPFVEPGDQTSRSMFNAHIAMSKKEVRRLIDQFSNWSSTHSAPCDAIQNLVDAGLKWNYLGMDFSAVQHSRRNTSTNGFDEDIAKVIDYYYKGTCKTCFPLLEADHTLRFASFGLGWPGAQALSVPSLRGALTSKFAKFRKEGYMKINGFGIDIDTLARRAEEILKEAPDEKLYAQGAELLGLDVAFKNQDLLSIASWYLGSDVEVTGYKLLRLGPQVSENNYISGLWHHDGCGTRLKMFVFLQDVKKREDCPTEIAVGSQNTAYFKYGWVGPVRFLDAYVGKNYHTRPMYGNRGEGFMFDTNTVHRGFVEGQHATRDAIIIDLMTVPKLTTQAKGQLEGPCPEMGTFKVKDVRHRFRS